MIKGARLLKYRCQWCPEGVEVCVLGDEEVGKIVYACKFCGYVNSFYGEQDAYR